MFRALLCLATVLLPSADAQIKTPAAVPAPAAVTTAPASPQPIPLTQIAVRHEELARTLRDISRRLPGNQDLSAFDEQLGNQEELIRNSLISSAEAMAGHATIMELREQIREWRSYTVTEAQDRKTLTGWGDTCEQSLSVLNDVNAVWEATLNSAKDLPEYEPVVPRIRSALKDIETVKREAEQHVRVVLDLQDRVSKLALTVADVLEKLTKARQEVRAHLFRPDAPPIWQVVPEAQTDAVRTVLGRSLETSYATVLAGLRESNSLATLVILLVIALAAVYRLSREILRVGSSDPLIIQASRLLARPLALALLIIVPLALLAYPLARMSAVLVLAQLFLIPITRLLPLYTASARVIYLFSGFFALNGVLSVLDVDPVMRRYLLAAVFAVTTGIFAWWGRPSWLRRAGPAGDNARREIRYIRWSLAVLIPLLILNVAGFLLLSHLLRLSILLSWCFGLVFYTLARVSETLFAATLRFPRICSLASVRMYEARLVKWFERFIRLGTLICWICVTLRLLEANEAVFGAVVAVLNARPGGTVLNFSLGDLLAFLTVLIVGYLAASAVRFVLREEILPHWRLSRGIPDTISTSLYYVLLVLVFFMSVNAAGIQLDKLTVLTGAFGVGLGFGLQNVVNNFVSGLILQFERPIRVGDVLEVGTLGGEIRRIGVRSSTMRTFQGAEVIIPNSTFVSGQVVNWTLSEPRRRVDIPVHVAYGTDPERVISMLVDIARSHPQVLQKPNEPAAVFQGFGDSSLDFLLMFWAEQDTHFQLRSDISVSINTALREAEIEIPYPCRDIRVHSTDVNALRQPA